jgi:hypothetical protein
MGGLLCGRARMPGVLVLLRVLGAARKSGLTSVESAENSVMINRA